MSMDKFNTIDWGNYRRYLGILPVILEGTNGYVGGGCFKNLFEGTNPRDIDVYFTSEEDFENAVKEYDCNKRYKLYDTPNVVAYSVPIKGVKYTVELVRKMFKEPKDIISEYDFTVTKAAFFRNPIVTQVADTKMLMSDNKQFTFIYHKDFFEHLQLKKLVLDDKVTLPVNTFNRMIKYIKYGYTPCTETKSKLIEALRETDQDFNNPTTFYDGLD